MDSGSPTEEIREVCLRIASEVTQLHRSAAKLRDGPERAEILKALFELTKNVEVVKKQLRKLDSGDSSRLT